jgi:glycerol-3-phosphate O-acyltransferase
MPLDVASAMDSCIKEHHVSMEDARKIIKDLIEESWKDVNEEWLKPDNAQPRELLERILNLTRTMEYMYKQEDALTTSHAVKGTINSLFVESFPSI